MNTTQSDAIAIGRVLCIFLMIFVHVNPGHAAFEPAEFGLRAFDLVRMFLIDTGGRASVALLSILSGYLAVRSLRKSGWLGLVKGKARSLVLPMMLWSGVFLLVVLAGDMIRDGYYVQTFGTVPDALTVIQRWAWSLQDPANGPLDFLRDLFVCMLILPMIIKALERSVAATLLAGFAFMMLTDGLGLLATPSILFLFSIGVQFARMGGLPQVNAQTGLASLLVFFGMGAFIAAAEIQDLAGAPILSAFGLDVLFNLIRIPAAIAFWWGANALARMHLGAAIKAVEPYVFLAFCTHMITLTALWAVWSSAIGGFYHAAYPVFFFAGPVAAFLAAWAMARIGMRIWPAFLAVLNGGRVVATALRGPRSHNG